MKLNVHFEITLVMKNLNAGENFSQQFKKSKHHQIPKVWRKKEFQSERCGITLFVEV